MPNQLPSGTRRRRDARFHNDACRRNALRIAAKVAQGVEAALAGVQA